MNDDRTCTRCLHYGHRAGQCKQPIDTLPEPERPPEPKYDWRGVWPFDMEEDAS